MFSRRAISELLTPARCSFRISDAWSPAVSGRPGTEIFELGLSTIWGVCFRSADNPKTAKNMGMTVGYRISSADDMRYYPQQKYMRSESISVLSGAFPGWIFCA